MCKQGIMIARSTSSRTAAVVADPDTEYSVLPANPNRTSLAFGLTRISGTPDSSFVMAYTYDNDVVVPILGVSPDHNVDRVTIEEFGSLILGPIFVKGQGTDVSRIVLSEAFLTTPLELF